MMIWMKPTIVADQFCKNIKINVKPGVQTGHIRLTNRLETTVTITGLDFNTTDNFVTSYLGRFGKIQKGVEYLGPGVAEQWGELGLGPPGAGNSMCAVRGELALGQLGECGSDGTATYSDCRSWRCRLSCEMVCASSWMERC